MRFFIVNIFFILSLSVLHANNALLDRFHVCTVASYKSDNLNKLICSCDKHHIDLEIVGLDLPYYGNGTKLLRMSEYVQTLNDGDIVMFVDAFDVLMIADKEVILNKFLAMKTPFVMSAEKGCFPFADLANDYPETSSVFKYVNSGGYIGYVKSLKKWFNELKPFHLKRGDQGQVTTHYLKNKNAFVIDYDCQLFLSLFEVKSEEIEIDHKQGVVRCLLTGSEPCVAHANGKAFTLWDSIYEKLVIGH